MSIHVCACPDVNGAIEYHLRYPGLSEESAMALANHLNSGASTYHQGILDYHEEVKQLCRDFSDRQDRPYMGDVVSSLDALRDRLMLDPSVKARVEALEEEVRLLKARNHEVACAILDNDRSNSVKWARGLVLETNSLVGVALDKSTVQQKHQQDAKTVGNNTPLK